MSLFIANNKMMSINGTPLILPEVEAFTFKIDTTKGNGFNSFKIPTYSGAAYNFSYRVDYTGAWTPITAWDQPETLITFPSAGIYTIEVRGTVGAWNDNNTGDVQKYEELLSFGDTIFNSIIGMFYGAINLKFAGSSTNKLVIKGPNAPNALSASRIFMNSGLNYIPEGIFSRMPKITNLNYAFSLCASLTGNIPTDILRNVPNLYSAVYFLQDCFYLTGTIPTDILRYVPDLRSLEGFLYRCTRLTGGLPVDFFRYVPKVTNINTLLYNCAGIVSVLTGDEFKYLTNVTTALRCMQGVYGLSGVIPSLYNMPLLTNVSYYFADNRRMALPSNLGGLFNLDTIYKITNWDNCLKVTDTNYTHTGTLQPIWDYELETATGKSTAFLNCTALTNYGQLRIEWP